MGQFFLMLAGIISGFLVASSAPAQEFRIPGYGNNNNEEPAPYQPRQRPRRTLLDQAADPLCDNNHRNSALMIIDMQDKFVLRGGRALRRDNAEKAAAVIKEQVRAIEAARKADLPIIFVEYENQGPTNPQLKKAVEGYGKAKFITKDTDGVFEGYNKYRRDLKNIIREEKIKNFIMAGANGGACVQQSIQGALAANCNVVAFERGIADFNYRKYVWPYTYQEFYSLHFNQTKGACVNCDFRQVNSVADLTPFMVNTQQMRTQTSEQNSDVAR